MTGAGLAYLMTSWNEAHDIDLFLGALAQIMDEDDRFLVFHQGDGDTLTRLQGFAIRHRTQIIQTDNSVMGLGGLLKLGVQMPETEYCLTLNAADRLPPDAVAALKGRLAAEEQHYNDQTAPGLYLINSAWRLADPTHPLP